MKTTIYLFTILAAGAMVFSCAKTATTSTGMTAKQGFDAWLEVNHPELVGHSVFPGYYILEDEAGSGVLAGDSGENPYAYVRYTSYGLEGDIAMSTERNIAERLGEDMPYFFYGPAVVARGENNCYVGVDATISGMREGGRKKVIVPPWLITNSRYSTEQEYIDNFSSGLAAIYDIRLEQVIKDINVWQIDSIERYCTKTFGAKMDSLKYGFYKKQIKAPTDTASFTSDTTVYINYVCRRLDGTVVDATYRDTAVKYGFYESGHTYEPVLAKWTETYSDITITSSSTSVIDGFAYLLHSMKSYEKAIGIFYSGLGYGSTDTDAIPAFSPLQFEIELVAKP